MIRTVQAFDAKRHKQDAQLFDALYKGMVEANKQTADIMKLTTRFKDRTGALRAAIGAKNKTTVQWLRRNLVTKSITSYVGIQNRQTRKYAWPVGIITGFTIEAMTRSPAIYQREILAATARGGRGFA